MQLIAPELVFTLVLAVICTIFFFLFLVLIVHPLMPKQITEKYFKSPHFSQTECAFFSGFPFAPIRSVMFMRVIAFPRSGTKRGITGASEMAKPWLRCVSYFIVCSFIILNVIVLSTLALYYGYKLVLLVLRF